jgi:mevalonate kinase
MVPSLKHRLIREREELKQKIIENILRFFKISEKIEIKLAGDLTVFTGGIGASAALAAAVSRAVNNFFGLNCDDNKINEAAYEGEKVVHGNPSGIDNTAAVFGGLFLFKKGLIEKIKIKKTIEIVLIDSGIINSTKAVIEEVRKDKEDNKAKLDLILKEYLKLVQLGKRALQDFDLEKLGEFMDKNHILLKELGVSCSELDKIVGIAKKLGALGAKLTGTGKGGIVIALTPGKDLQEIVAQEFKKLANFSFKSAAFS